MGLWKNFQHESVERLALREPVTATATETIREAITRMRQQKLGCTIVRDDALAPIGILTESALTQLLSEQGAKVLAGTLGDYMETPCPCVRLTDPIARVVEAMQTKNLRFLCVIDAAGKIAGLTGQKGLIEFVAEHFPGQIMVQRIGGRPNPSSREGA